MKLVCIKCPRGCELTIDGDSVTGNFCPRGLTYAKEEMSCPMRTVTALIKVDGGVVPVKTDKEVPKAKVFDVLNEISKLKPKSVKFGQTVLKNVCDTGANIVVTGDKYINTAKVLGKK